MKYYCIGIKGAGMSTLAQILNDLGNEVTGYDDVVDYKFTQEGLDKRNIKIYYDNTHDIDKDTIVTYSAAFSEDHREIKRVKELGLRIEKYHDILGSLTNIFNSVCVCGTHGKTTTSSLIAHVFKNTLGCNYFIGDGSGYAKKDNQFFVIESCEYNKHFLAYFPYYTVITNIELEHTEVYKDIEEIRATFLKFANKTKKMIVACGDDENIRLLKFDKDVIYYGFNEDNDIVAKNVKFEMSGSTFDVYIDKKFYGNFKLPLYGRHMILNTLACIGICNLENIEYQTIHDLLGNFQNAKRRFCEEKVLDCIVVDDYAHHPTEIKVTLESAKQKYPDKKLIAVFKPNTYSRTKDFYQEFAQCLNIADEVYLTDIECNREKQEDYEGVSSRLILKYLNNGAMTNDEDIKKLAELDNCVICFMSCASVVHLIDNYKKAKLERKGN